MMDFIVVAIGLLIVLLSVGISRWLFQAERVSFAIARKVVHLVSIGTSAAAVVLMENLQPLIIVVSISLPILIYLVKQGFFQDPKSGEKGWGVLYFALSFLGLLVFFGDQPAYLFYPLLILAIADGFAAILGEFYGRHKYVQTGRSKTLEGSLMFMFSCIICLGIVPSFFDQFDPPILSLPAILIASFALTIGEAIFEKGTDNLIIPALVVYWMYLDLAFISYLHVVVSISLVALALLAVRAQALTRLGAMAATLMGILLIVSPEPRWAVAAVVLFIGGTILSKLPGSIEMDGNARNAKQVLANGGVPSLFLMVYFASEDPAFLVGSFAGFAAALSDTASSEIGTRFRQSTVSILSFKPVSPGLSGGISWIGLLAGLIFSFLMSSVAVNLSTHVNMALFALIGICGFAANLFDSIIGDIWQIKYQNTSGEWTDYPPERIARVKGFKFMTNDLVNFLAVLFGSVLASFLFSWL